MNEKAPLVSVVVPNYNYARYLDARLSSILNQTFQDFELILLDDASTDNSLEILNKYKNNRKHSKKCTFYTLRFGCSFAAVNTIKPQLL